MRVVVVMRALASWNVSWCRGCASAMALRLLHPHGKFLLFLLLMPRLSGGEGGGAVLFQLLANSSPSNSFLRDVLVVES